MLEFFFLLFSPPTRLRRFFGVGKKKHKKMKTVEEQKEISVIIFDVDSSDDNQQQVIDECGWYILAPMSPMTKVLYDQFITQKYYGRFRRVRKIFSETILTNFLTKSNLESRIFQRLRFTKFRHNYIYLFRNLNLLMNDLSYLKLSWEMNCNFQNLPFLKKSL